jgi:hypothetical protein
MLTSQVSCDGVPVMVKVVVALVVLVDFVKKVLLAVPSTPELTAMVTPLGGMVEVTVTVRVKVGPGAGAWSEPEAGLVVIVRAASGVLLPLEPHDSNAAPMVSAASTQRMVVLMK